MLGEGEGARWPEPGVKAESEAGPGEWAPAFSRGPVCTAGCGARDPNAQLGWMGPHVGWGPEALAEAAQVKAALGGLRGGIVIPQNSQLKL